MPPATFAALLGGFFLMADTSAIRVPQEYLGEVTAAAPNGVTRDWAFCRWMALEGGVIAIPASPFYSAENKELAAGYIRFAFCKGDDTIEEACARIEKLVAGRKEGDRTSSTNNVLAAPDRLEV